MSLEDTHVVPTELLGLQITDFDTAVVKDASAKPMRLLFGSDINEVAASARGRTPKRLVVHVNDMEAPGLDGLLLKALRL